ncbi:MAG: SWIM zinc finger family protein [Desulfobacterales bacterium]
MTEEQNTDSAFAELNWSDLTDWAGEKIVSRGKSYQKNGSVSGLSRTRDGELIAWVNGTERYVTAVRYEEGELRSRCTCPYWSDCKHAVAVVLEYLSRIKKGETIPETDKNDPRLQILEDEADEPAEENDDHTRYAGRNAVPQKQIAELESFLKQKSKEELTEIIKEMALEHPAVFQDFQNQIRLCAGNVKDVLKTLRREIRSVSAEPAWSHHWDSESHIPDYSQIRKKIEALSAQGYADEVLAIGNQLLEYGTRQVEMSEDEGETAEEIASCMSAVFAALPNASLSPWEQILWAIDAGLRDEYDLCDDSSFLSLPHKKEDWSRVADELLKRLKKMSSGKGEDSFSRNYKRDRVCNYAIEALENAGREAEVIPLCTAEAPLTGSYDRLVERLMEQQQWKEAEEWIHKGIAATKEEYPGIASELREKLREIREKDGDWTSAAAMHADDFFHNPCTGIYQKLKAASEKADIWPKVRDCVLDYLKTGKLPAKTWPLPKPAGKKRSSRFGSAFPNTYLLTDIAIAENRPAEVLHWYEKHKAMGQRWHVHSLDRIAEIIKKAYPDHAVEIWKEKAERLIAEVNPKSYASAARYLAKVHDTMKAQNREEQWQEYISRIRTEHRRKKKLMEILDNPETGKILDSLKQGLSANL